MGGAENIVVSLADNLSLRGHDLLIVYLTGEALVMPKNPNIKVVSIGITSARDFLIAFHKVRKVLKEFRPDVVHSHMVHANIMARLLRLTMKIPRLICTAHSNNEGGRMRMLAYRITDSLADMSTNVSASAVSSFIRKGAVKEGRMISVPNGINVDKFKYDPCARQDIRASLNVHSKQLILAVGRLEPAKDYPLLFASIALLKKRTSNFTVIIVGEGTLKKELEILIEKMGIQDYVNFIGVRRDIAKIMSAADVFVLSSAWEGFGLVVAEAMACERMVVATDCGGVKEILGETNVLVPLKSPSLLADGLFNSLKLSETEKTEMGKKSRMRIIEKYSLSLMADKFLSMYVEKPVN